MTKYRSSSVCCGAQVGSLGEFLDAFHTETIIAAQLLGIDAFDQPAVEEGKVPAKRYLNGGA
jgi:glucose-6-phosphate isomerase